MSKSMTKTLNQLHSEFRPWSSSTKCGLAVESAKMCKTQTNYAHQDRDEIGVVYAFEFVL